MAVPRLAHGPFLPDFQSIVSAVILLSTLYDYRFAWGHKIDLKIDNSDGSVHGYTTIMSETCRQQLCWFRCLLVKIHC
jgi:hypothetical protein